MLELPLSELHFVRPWWLLALFGVPVFIWLLHRQQKQQPWQRVCDPILLAALLEETRTHKRIWPSLLFILASVLAVLALAGPSWQQQLQSLYRQESALILALDLSRSMDSTDLTPSRLSRARHKLQDILKLRREGQTALLVYAAQPFVVTPLTDDNKTISALVNRLTTDLMPIQGTRPDLVVAEAIRLFQQAGVTHGDLLLLTDDLGKIAINKILQPLTADFRLSVLGIGATGNAPIPEPEGGFVKDAAGQLVIAPFNQHTLAQLAQQGGGLYQQIALDDQDIRTLLTTMEQRHQAAIEKEQQERIFWREQGYWLVLLILPLAMLSFRRGWLMVFVIVLLPVPAKVHAWDWSTLWFRTEQQAAHLFGQNRYQEAARSFTDPQWQAVAHYRSGQYQQAIALLAQMQTAEAIYNRANALAELGQLQEALAAYEQVLTQQPVAEDARYNAALIREALQQPSLDESSTAETQPNQSQSQQAVENTAPQTSPTQPSNDQQSPTIEPPPSAPETEPTINEPQSLPDEQPQHKPEKETQDPALEQWLRRVPDDPGGLLKRKFQYQLEQRAQQQPEQQPW